MWAVREITHVMAKAITNAAKGITDNDARKSRKTKRAVIMLQAPVE
jgi:hypothetical protein